jgi:hypothetical protein
VFIGGDAGVGCERSYRRISRAKARMEQPLGIVKSNYAETASSSPDASRPVLPWDRAKRSQVGSDDHAKPVATIDFYPGRLPKPAAFSH